jgi:hypothetical protein
MLSARDRIPPTIRLRTVESTVQTLRAHFARHNQRVVLIAAGTLVASAAAWLLLYIVCTWVFVFVCAVFDGPAFDTPFPRELSILFVVAAVCAVGYVWLDRRLTPNEQPADEKRAGGIIVDFILAVPRMTLSVWGTLEAWQRLSDDDFAQAAGLLHRLADERRLPMSSVRLDIPDPDAAMRIIFGLQLTQVVDVQREKQEFWLKLNALRPPELRLARESYADA